MAKSDQSFISRYVDIMLESGAGPTVQEALKNPALFSMVIQISLLAFGHEDESLANATVLAIENILRDSKAQTANGLEYVSLLGTIRACRQQTSAFQWSPYYRTVEEKIQAAIDMANQATRISRRSAKRRKEEPPRKPLTMGITNRSLPFAVYQSLLMWLQSLQTFPEYRLLHLKCDTGISTVVIWCHYILGLDVNVRLNGVDIYFGSGTSNVFIEETARQKAGALLLDPASQNEPLFKLSKDDEHPMIDFESRVDAFGYGMKILQAASRNEDELRVCAYWITGKSLQLSRAKKNLSTLNPLDPISPREPLTEQMIFRAGQFLFALDQMDIQAVEESSTKPAREVEGVKNNMRKIEWPALVAILLTFARIRDLDSCKNMPLSLEVYRRFKRYEYGIVQMDYDTLLPIPNLTKSFDLLCRLLLGHSYSDDYVASAVLISAWGWSIFFDSIDAVDPEDVSVDTMRVMAGVPSRRGVRKARIIDGPADIRLSSTIGENLDKEGCIVYYPGVSTAKRGPVLIGHSGSDSFSVTQSFDWRSGYRDDRKYKIGFREMQDFCLGIDDILACQCENTKQETLEWIGAYSIYDFDRDLPDVNEIKAATHQHYVRSSPICLPVNHERVFHPQRLSLKARIGEASALWLFYVTDNPAARWLQLDDFYSIVANSRMKVSCYIKGKECCMTCVPKLTAAASADLVLVLL